MKIFRYLKESNGLVLALLLISFVGIIVWRLTTYYYGDDLNYLCVAPLTNVDDFCFCKGRHVETFADVCESVYNHYHTVNCRLANIICIVKNLWPLWVTNVFDGIVVCSMLVMLFKVARVRMRRVSVAYVAGAVALFWLALPWYDHMQASSFTENYVLPSAMLLGVISICHRSYKLTRAQLAASCLFTFLAGWTHEAFACSFIAYLFIMWWLGDKRSRRSRFIIGIFLCLGLIAAFGVGTVTRFVDNYSGIGLHVYKYLISRYLSQSWPLLLAIIATIVLRRRLGKRRFGVYRVRTIATFVAIGVSYVIALKVASDNRALWPAHLFAVLQIMVCANTLCKHRAPLSLRAKVLWSCAIAAYALWFCELAKWQQRMSNDTKAIIAEAKNTDLPLIYYDLTDDQDIPFYLLGIPHGDWNYELFRNIEMASYCWKQPSFILLPTAYRSVPFDSIYATPSGNVMGVWPMLYATDSTAVANAYFGEPTAAATPIDRVLMKFTPDTLRFETTSIYGVQGVEINGKTYYLNLVRFLGRISKHRRFIKLTD